MNDNAPSSDLKTFLAQLTSEPGVYRMLDKDGVVLYVGKARDLKKRVGSYFTKSNVGVKTRSLINQVASVSISVTRSETEALLLESNLIKSIRPKYNVLLRDDKSYPYIHISKHEQYPRMEMVRFKKRPTQGEFFGPYPSVAAVRSTLSVIQKVFKIRNCSDSFFSGRSRPCLQYQIKRCSAPCTNAISANNYEQTLKDAVRFLQGKCQDIIEELQQRMENAVANLEFEQAARLRDQIKSLRLVQEQQSMVQLRGDADVIAIEARPGFACIQYVTVRDGQILANQSYFPSVPEQMFAEVAAEDELWQQVFSAFVAYFYMDTPERIPALILTDRTLADQETLQDMLTRLRGKQCRIQSTPRGIKARWLEFARNNLRLALSEHAQSETILKNRYDALQQALKITSIKRMECFDISHTQGEATVASCVVFDSKGPVKSEYRRFNIHGVTKGDDYAAMEQVLTRRFKKAAQGGFVPDLVIIDGGKGQLSVAERVMRTLNLSGVNLLGIAKGPRRKAGWEQLILANSTQEITLSQDSPALHLLQFIRDEAHRFAITFHRKKRQRTRMESSLETIEGIGAKRRQALLKGFGGLRELAKAPVEEIAKIRGISLQLATKIHQHFHS
jgi:excinuclease ABC subunit C